MAWVAHRGDRFVESRPFRHVQHEAHVWRLERRDLNPDVAEVDVNADDLCGPPLRTGSDSTLIQRAKPSIRQRPIFVGREARKCHRHPHQRLGDSQQMPCHAGNRSLFYR
jgi:hypothetical protein